MRYRALTIILLITSLSSLHGQSDEKTGDTSDSLSLRIKTISFVKNNEYFNPVTEGYTLIGAFLQPELVYSPTDKITVSAGVHLLKYSGIGKFSQVRPVLSTSLKLSEKTTLTIGSLSGSDKHRLFDPHFDSEHIYNSNLEEGFQLIRTSEHIFTDTWLNWENYIFKGDSDREVFTFGESFRYTSSKVGDIMEFEIPVQVQFKHFGGQISNYPEPVETFFNFAAGLRANIDLAGKKYGQAGIEYLRFLNNEFNGESQSGISFGYASWTRFHYTYKSLYIGMAYWRAHNYFAPNGNYIYGCVSDYQTGIVIPDRKIITNFVYLTILPESYLELFLGLETYYDVDIKRLDNAIALHLNFDKLIRLAILKH